MAMTSLPVSGLSQDLTVLWVEPPNDLLANKTLILDLACCCVTLASSHREVFELRANSAFSVAILSDALGSLMLAAVARCVRSNWPTARILLLRRKQPTLDDHLYDEDLEYRLLPKEVVAKLAKMDTN